MDQEQIDFQEARKIARGESTLLPERRHLVALFDRLLMVYTGLDLIRDQVVLLREALKKRREIMTGEGKGNAETI